MTPAARIAAAIEILAAFEAAETTLDRFLRSWLKSRRYVGSKDRRAIREQVYRTVRFRSELAYAVQGEDARLLVGAALMKFDQMTVLEIAELYAAEPYGAGALSEHEVSLIERSGNAAGSVPLPVKGNFPDWLEPQILEVFGDETAVEMKALLQRAPTDLRVNTLKACRDDVLSAIGVLGFEVSRCPISPVGLRLSHYAPIEQSELFRTGQIEVQDEGSQIAAMMVAARPGHLCIDYCAGAGGKSLALAASMNNVGKVFCFDVTTKRLKPLPERIRRSGVKIISQAVLKTPRADAALENIAGAADRVLIDAPCSGSGTWRRAPDTKWSLTPEKLAQYRRAQAEVLREGSGLIKPGGRLVYVTCSILPDENDKQISGFLEADTRFEVQDWRQIWSQELPGVSTDLVRGTEFGVLLTPNRTGTDGFYVAVVERVR